MNGSLFVASATRGRWRARWTHTNFPAEPVARLNALPETDIAWFNAGRHPAQQIISISAATEGKLADSGANTTSAISVAGDSDRQRAAQELLPYKRCARNGSGACGQGAAPHSQKTFPPNDEPKER